MGPCENDRLLTIRLRSESVSRPTSWARCISHPRLVRWWPS